MIIGIDIDDTISNTYEISVKYLEEYAEKYLKRKLTFNPAKKAVDHHYIKHTFELKDGEDIDFWEKYWDKITENISPKENAVEIINKLKNEGNTIVIITARWDMCGVSALEVSKKWLSNNKIPFDDIIVNVNNKAEIAENKNIDYFIDDSIKNCEEVKAKGIKSYLFCGEMNKHYDSDYVEKVYSWNEIYEKIKGGK